MHCHAIKNKIKNHAVDKVKKLWHHRRQMKKLKVCALSQSWDIRRNAPRKTIEPGPPIWRPVNSVNIRNFLWLSSRLIIWTEPSTYICCIYSSTYHEISLCSVYFPTKTIISQLYITHHHNLDVQNALVSKRRTLLSRNVVNRYKYSTSYTWWG